MDDQLLGVIDATSYATGMEDLMHHRSLAAVPIAGRYRMIDFILSSMVNSGVNSVAIFPKYQYRSLMDHLGSGRNWDLNRKRDGLFFFPSPQLDDSKKRVGAFQHFQAHIDYFKRSRQTYVIIANCFTLASIDFRPILSWHMNHDCDITDIRKDGKSLEMYIIKRELLMDLVERSEETGFMYMKDVVTSLKHNYSVCLYEYQGRAHMLNSIETFYEQSMDLLKPEIFQQVFRSDFPVYTKVKDEPPTQYTRGSKASQSLIANGCTIAGTVDSSILFRAVTVGENSKVESSIIMQKSLVGNHCHLSHCILDKDVHVEDGTVLIGTKEEPIVLKKGTRQKAVNVS
ncbi:GlgC family sugar phosphate nucleotidyltransferase [Bacillus fonticola]|uniref:sugar phosphate nucleotidyltransferase n=1 Tax=Bacillus fonticola TaxID=2728853 RepID=UPI00147615FE|nr:sugar phosphate nucleotidyltransferase [Bacillus fonticola]